MTLKAQLTRQIFTVVAIFGVTSSAAYADETIDCVQSEALSISGNVKLTPQCRYASTIRITSSNTTLDCQGALIDGEGKRQYGIQVDSNGEPLKNVEIRNCRIENEKGEGVMIGWSAPDRAKAEAHGRSALYALTPTNVRLRNLTVRNSGGVGIYIDDYVTHAEIDHCSVSGSGSVGVYLEHSSRGTTIRDSQIVGNGVTQKREGIAIDSSADNTVIHSTIADNAGGGIFLYRNCSEHYAEDPKQVKRWQSADHNTIESNDISGGKTGVWVASRQSIDLSGMQCGNGYYAEGKYTLDSAKSNTVASNRIRDAQYGVIVEDDNNTVQDNILDRISKIGIKVGSIPRQRYLKEPVAGVSLMGNRFGDVAQRIATVGDAQISVAGQQ